jgi:hypothetical protein
MRIFGVVEKTLKDNSPGEIEKNLRIGKPYKVHPYTGTEALYRPYGP